MMSRTIMALPEDVAAQIAAGEVVERPSSVVKELVENAIDAGATRIDVELEEGGMRSIRVTDDGAGIESFQVPRVFERHSTSKISSFSDLYRLSTLGFRGEAMYSIAAVARVELLTRTREDLAGTRCRIEGGQMVEHVDAGCPAGTSVRVSDLFYATPARKKFLKRPSTEQARCLDIATRLALANPRIAFQVTANTRLLLAAPQAESSLDRLFLLKGRDFRDNAVIIDRREDGGMGLSGALSRPGLTRSSPRELFWFVNGRPLRDTLLHQAVMAAYRGLIEPRRYPLGVLFLEVAGEDVDVNVHPAKFEVRFRNPAELFRSVSAALGEGLARIGGSGWSGTVPERRLFPPALRNGETAVVGEREPRYRIVRSDRGVPSPPDRGFRDGLSGGTGNDLLSPGQGAEPSESAFFSALQYLGQVAGTYLVFSDGTRLLLMDQHAAHERVVYEKLKTAGFRQSPHSQRLLLPVIIDLTPGFFAHAVDLLPLLQRSGFEIEPFGETSLSLKAAPAVLAHVDLKRLIVDALGEIDLTGTAGVSDETRERLMAVMACHDAVRGNRSLGEEEARALCRDLDATPNAWTCPHGRPLFVVMDKRELARLFKRT